MSDLMQALRIGTIAGLLMSVATFAACGHHMDDAEDSMPDAAVSIEADAAVSVDAAPDSPSPTPMVTVLGTRGEVFYALGGTKGTVLCFHGAGGRGGAWKNGEKRMLLDSLIARGYSVVCPTSVDRTTEQWSPDNTSSNPDVVNVDGVLADLGIPANTKLFVIGHSNGGGFTSRFALASTRRSVIRAIQLSNASGLGPAMKLDAYVYPTLFNYADCDPIVDAVDVRANQQTLAMKSPAVPYIDNDLDALYSAGTFQTCHEFASTPQTTGAFFDLY